MTELALHLIEENKKTRATFLDLGNCGLTKVPMQNTWATEAVFKMLDDEIVKKSLGRFTLQDCQRVWHDSVYADMHPELLALMQKFELCYRLPDAKQETWLTPQLLPPSKPVKLVQWEHSGDLVLRYRYEFMPKGLISRLMVRLHRFVSQPELGWVTGVLFQRDGSQVLVEIPPRGGEIALRARGPERKELLSVIAADLDALNDSFHKLQERVEKLVPCNCSQCRTRPMPESFEQKRLLQRKHDGKFKVECPASYENVDVFELLDGINVKTLPRWAAEESPSKKTGNITKIFISYSKMDITHKDNLLKHLLLVPKLLLGNEVFEAPASPRTANQELAIYGFPSRSLGTSQRRKTDSVL